MRPIPSGYILRSTLARAQTTTKTTLTQACEAGVVGRRVTELLREASMPPSELGAAVGMPTARVRELMAGQMVLSPERLASIAAALKVEPSAITEPERYLTTEAAVLCGVARDTIVGWVRRGHLTGERADNGRWWVDLSAVKALAGKRPEVPRGGKEPHPPVGDVGIRIFAEMRRQGLTQVAVVAKCVDLTQSRLSTIIRGQYSPTVERLKQIARALGTTAAELLRPPTDEDRQVAGLRPAS